MCWSCSLAHIPARPNGCESVIRSVSTYCSSLSAVAA